MTAMGSISFENFQKDAALFFVKIFSAYEEFIAAFCNMPISAVSCPLV